MLRRQLDFCFEPERSERALVLPDARSLEQSAAHLLSGLDCADLGARIRVEWNRRLRTCAGRADTRRVLISLNPRLVGHGLEEIDRTFRHELAHLLAQYRAGRRRITPHGPQWQKACKDLGIAGEARCHSLPFESRQLIRRYHYKCPKCSRDFPRVRKIRRVIACLACCRKYARGKFDKKFQLRPIA